MHLKIIVGVVVVVVGGFLLTPVVCKGSKESSRNGSGEKSKPKSGERSSSRENKSGGSKEQSRNCPKQLPVINDGYYVTQGYQPGDQSLVRCYGTKILIGPSMIECQNDGRWSSPGYCVNIGGGGGGGSNNNKCDQLPQIVNGYLSIGSSMVGATRIVSCYNGFYLVGADTTRCQNNGYWTPTGYCYEIGDDSNQQQDSNSQQQQQDNSAQRGNCDESQLPEIRNGFVGGGSNSTGSWRPVFCNFGYTRRGPRHVTCLRNGKWSAPGNCVRRKFSKRQNVGYWVFF